MICDRKDRKTNTVYRVPSVSDAADNVGHIYSGILSYLDDLKSVIDASTVEEFQSAIRLLVEAEGRLGAAQALAAVGGISDTKAPAYVIFVD